LAFALLTVGAWQQFGQLVITISGTDPFSVLPTRGFPLFQRRHAQAVKDNRLFVLVSRIMKSKLEGIFSNVFGMIEL